MANKVNNLQISFVGSVPGTLGVINSVAFTVTQTTIGAQASDDFGRFLQDRIALPAGAPAPLRGANQVQKWFQFSGIFTFQPAVAVSLDVVAATGSTLAALAPLDPALTRHFRVRAAIHRLVTIGEFSRSTVNGTIYVERKHSMDV